MKIKDSISDNLNSNFHLTLGVIASVFLGYFSPTESPAQTIMTARIAPAMDDNSPESPDSLITIQTSQVDLCWNSASNLTYQVEYRSELTSNLWTSLAGCILGNGSLTCISDSVVVGQPQRFYRLLQTSCVPPSSQSATQEVRQVVQRFYDAFDSGNFSRASEFTTEDWAHINPYGGWTRGRVAVLSEINAVHSSFLKGVTNTVEQIEIRFPTTSTAIATVPSKLSTYTTPNGVKHVDQKDIRGFFLVRRNNQWLIMQDQDTLR